MFDCKQNPQSESLSLLAEFSHPPQSQNVAISSSDIDIDLASSATNLSSISPFFIDSEEISPRKPSVSRIKLLDFI